MAKMNSLFPDELDPTDPPPESNRRKSIASAAQSISNAASGVGEKRVSIKELEAGREVISIFLVQDATLRLAKNGSKYIQANLMDKSGTIAARQWDASDAIFESYENGGYVKVKARVETYQTKLQMIVVKVKKIDPTTVDPGDYLPSSVRSQKDMVAEFDALLESFTDADYKRLLQNLFADPEFRDQFFHAPAAKTLHHAWIGGLLEHVLSASQTADVIAKQRPFLNRDLLVAGVILHDIGKMVELDAGPGFNYTDTGSLCGHITLGVLIVERCLIKMNDFPDQKRDLIYHMILSHHGTLEYGSPVTPKIPEALALHHVECMDAKIQGFQTLIETSRAGGADPAWTDYSRMADGRVFTKSSP